MMEENRKNEILNKAKKFFREVIAVNHIKNTKKLTNISEFKINPFLLFYKANFFSGDNSYTSLAKALVYPRVLGSSIDTSFGQNIQKFCSTVLEGFGSAIPGIDIEFDDQVDGRHKYCQLKAGPNTINKDDISTIVGHFQSTINQARANHLHLSIDDLIVGVLYGTEYQLSNHYKTIMQHYPVIVGQEFWYRLTGDNNFYLDLIDVFSEVAQEADGVELLENVISNLATELEELFESQMITHEDE
jgi:hypothetical protein